MGGETIFITAFKWKTVANKLRGCAFSDFDGQISGNEPTALTAQRLSLSAAFSVVWQHTSFCVQV